MADSPKHIFSLKIYIWVFIYTLVSYLEHATGFKAPTRPLKFSSQPQDFESLW